MTFAKRMGLDRGDVVIVPKSNLNMVQHFVVYWGLASDGIDYYVENIQFHGVRYITGEQFAAANPTYTRIRRFEGSSFQRGEAIRRAESLVGEKYHLTGFNCEDFANFVQFNKMFSKQTNTGAGIAAGLVLLALLGGLSRSR